MTTNTLFDTLEICLQALDQGADVESCLVRYPALADELRPILVAAVQARAAAVTEVPADVARRGRARVLQAAAEMREQQSAAPVLPFWRRKGFFSARFYRLAATTAVVIAFLLTGGTGLVNASSGALPGDRLYPVKRGWEGVQLVFVFNPQTKTELEHKFDNEREHEIEELYSEKRMEHVNFQGVVQTQQNDIWIIDGLSIKTEDGTVYVGEIILGSTVQVTGETDDGIIKAEQIILIATPGVTPYAVSTFTPVPATLPGIKSEGGELEGPQTSGAVEKSDSGKSIETEGSKAPDSSEKSGDWNDANISPGKTPHPESGDSNSSDGSSGDSSQPSTGDSGGDNSQPSTDNNDGGDN